MNLTRSLCFDLETVALPQAADYVPPPDLDSVAAPGTWKDPVKIADEIARKRVALEAEYVTAVQRAALDWNLGRIVAIGTAIDGGPAQVTVCHDEDQERQALMAFWALAQRQRLIGFNARSFDAPYLIQRSRYLDVPYTELNLARYGRGDIIDLREILTFDDARYEAIMPRSLDTFCRRFGIVVDDPTTGADIAAMVARDDWEGVEAHCRADVQRTRLLAERLHILKPVVEVVA